MATVGRFLQVPDGTFFLFGPRGTGKTTWLKQNLRQAVFLDLLDAGTFRTYAAAPERLGDLVKANKDAAWIVIDEIQKVPSLLDTVHQLIEQGCSQRFVLTGSSARKLRRAGVDLLGGRGLLRTLHPFMAAEIGATFDIETALTRGLLPIVYAALDPEGTLRSYVGLYIREEVQAEALVRNVGDFARFLEAASLSHAAILNLSEVARECQVSRKTAEGFLPILEDLLLGFRVPVFARRAKRRLVIHSKFFFADTGVFRSLRPRGPLDTPEEIGGAALEGLVAQHLRAWIAYTRETHALHYWRTRAGLEVDFVVYGDATFVALEVKSSRDVSSRDVRSLRAFLDEYPEAKACLLYRGRERIRVNGILCVPCEEFLSRLVPDATLPVE